MESIIQDMEALSELFNDINKYLEEHDQYKADENRWKFQIDMMARLINLVKESEKYIDAEKRRVFSIEAEMVLLDSNIALVEVLSKEVRLRSDEKWKEIAKKWRDIYLKYNLLKRRLKFLNPSSQEVFEAAIMWMIEQGAEEDINLIRKVKKNPPYSSENIERLFKMAEERISERIRENIHQKVQGEAMPTLETNKQHIAWTAFRHALPQLLQQAPHQWVAFHGDHQVALGDSKLGIYRLLEQAGCPLQEVVVRCIEPLEPPMNISRVRNMPS